MDRRVRFRIYNSFIDVYIVKNVLIGAKPTQKRVRFQPTQHGTILSADSDSDSEKPLSLRPRAHGPGAIDLLISIVLNIICGSGFSKEKG